MDKKKFSTRPSENFFTSPSSAETCIIFFGFILEEAFKPKALS